MLRYSTLGEASYRVVHNTPEYCNTANTLAENEQGEVHTSWPPQENVFICPPFFANIIINITNVFCAKKRVGHACICPRMVTSRPVLKLYPPPKSKFSRGQKMKIPHWKLFSWSNFFLKILAFYCLCGEIFVTPFSTLAMIKGSLPTNSTTPDRLRSWTKTIVKISPVLGFELCQKKARDPRSSGDLHPQRSP